ncbi:hypothetical protein B0H14DRAFT_2760543 [Mycena olivaceomarginata]|nr:hypothetical protein B0H14DRAFT_2760543 [Mycena olivaceomarginata]
MVSRKCASPSSPTNTIRKLSVVSIGACGRAFNNSSVSSFKANERVSRAGNVGRRFSIPATSVVSQTSESTIRNRLVRYRFVLNKIFCITCKEHGSLLSTKPPAKVTDLRLLSSVSRDASTNWARKSGSGPSKPDSSSKTSAHSITLRSSSAVRSNVGSSRWRLRPTEMLPKERTLSFPDV